MFLIGCSRPPDRIGLNLVTGSQPFYLTHHYQVDQELDSLKQKLGCSPAGLVIQTGITGMLSHPIQGAQTIYQLEGFLANHPGLTPFFVLYIDNNDLLTLCGGRFDADIANLRKWFQSLHRPAAITIGYQVDSPIWNIDPERFVTGYRCLVDDLTAGDVNNLSYGLYLSGMFPSYQQKDAFDWYPGDKYVNFIGITANRFTSSHFLSENQVFSDFNLPRIQAFSRERNLPIVILESTPTAALKVLPGLGDTVWQNYYEPLFDLLHRQQQIKGFTHHFADIQSKGLKQRFYNYCSGQRFSPEVIFKSIER